jgi:cell division protein ZapA (FtsZ GTPase activity inhibitor)
VAQGGLKGVWGVRVPGGGGRLKGGAVGGNDPVSNNRPKGFDLKENIVEIRVLGQKLVVKSDEEEEYIREVEDYLNAKIEEIKENTKAVSSLNLALLTALNVTGEYIRARKMLESVEAKSEELVQRIDRRRV